MFVGPFCKRLFLYVEVLVPEGTDPAPFKVIGIIWVTPAPVDAVVPVIWGRHGFLIFPENPERFPETDCTMPLLVLSGLNRCH